MPQEISPADELHRLLCVDTEEACKELATLLPEVTWDQENPWYSSRLYELLIMASKFDEPTLARAVCQVCQEHPGIKMSNSGKSLIQELLERAVKDLSHKALAASISFSPGYLPPPKYLEFLGRVSGKNMETLRVLLVSWYSVNGNNAALPPEAASNLLFGACSNATLSVLKFVLPLTATTRSEISAALARSVNFGNDKVSRFLVKKASVCEALLHSHDRLSNEEVYIAYDRFAEEMDEMDVLATNYLLGDKFHLPKIQARAQSMRLRASASAPSSTRPRRRL